MTSALHMLFYLATVLQGKYLSFFVSGTAAEDGGEEDSFSFSILEKR